MTPHRELIWEIPDKEDTTIEAQHTLELPSKEVLLKLYRDLVTARRMEAKVLEIVSSVGFLSHRRHPLRRRHRRPGRDVGTR